MVLQISLKTGRGSAFLICQEKIIECSVNAGETYARWVSQAYFVPVREEYTKEGAGKFCGAELNNRNKKRCYWMSSNSIFFYEFVIARLKQASYAARYLQHSPSIQERYDKRCRHLVTAAKGAEEFYTTANNTARTETVEQAAALDDKLIAAWTGHPHLRVIDNTSDFEMKMKRLIAEITAFLGEPEPYEIERKFLIEYPDIKALEKLPNCKKVEIIQGRLHMGLFDFLKKNKKEKSSANTDATAASHLDNEVKKGLETAVASSSIDLSMAAAEKDMFPKSTEADLLGIFAEYFAPNKELYTQVGTPAYTAYFDAIARAKKELLSNASLFEDATKWKMTELEEMMNNPKPGITNMILLGLIFRAGWYCVIESALTCVDFCEKLPNCIALYLLLTAKKKPADQRKQRIDSGDRSNPQQLSQAIDRLKVCDSSWEPMILNMMFKL